MQTLTPSQLPQPIYPGTPAPPSAPVAPGFRPAQVPPLPPMASHPTPPAPARRRPNRTKPAILVGIAVVVLAAGGLVSRVQKGDVITEPPQVQPTTETVNPGSAVAEAPAVQIDTSAALATLSGYLGNAMTEDELGCVAATLDANPSIAADLEAQAFDSYQVSSVLTSCITLQGLSEILALGIANAQGMTQDAAACMANELTVLNVDQWTGLLVGELDAIQGRPAPQAVIDTEVILINTCR